MTIETDTGLDYIDHDGANRTVRGCTLTVDQLGRHYIWSEQLQHNLVYKTKGLDNALLAAIDRLLFTIHLKDERIKELERVSEAVNRFINEVRPPDDNDY